MKLIHQIWLRFKSPIMLPLSDATGKLDRDQAMLQWNVSVCQIRFRTKLFAENVFKLSNVFLSIR
jgi:hypothetical protein